jgi:hypothetical protein
MTNKKGVAARRIFGNNKVALVKNQYLLYMFKIKYLTTLLLCITVITCYGQQDGMYLLKWKLQPKEVVTYKTFMKTERGSKADLSGFAKQMDLDTNGTGSAQMQSFMKDIERFTPDHYLTHLEKKRGGVIKIEMVPINNKVPNDTSVTNGFSQLMSAMSTEVALRAAVYENGAIQSFYLRNDQANIVALFFQLPGKPVKVGDTWEVGTNFISLDQNFKCDSSFRRNNVTLSSIEKVGDDNVVTIKYNIEEFVTGNFSMPFPQSGSDIKMKSIETSFKVIYKAAARFSVKQGRWLSYEGEFEETNTGMMAGHSLMKYALIPQ